MTDLRVITTTGKETVLEAATVEKFKASLRGALLRPGDAVYDEARAVCYNGSLDAGEKVLRPLREFGPPLADQISPIAYGQVQTLFDAAFVRGRRYYFKSNFMQRISDGAIDTLIERFATIPSPLSLVYFEQLGKAANRIHI
jgi:hypothetical protein